VRCVFLKIIVARKSFQGYAKFKVLKEVIIKIGLSVFWNVTPCSLVYTYRQFG